MLEEDQAGAEHQPAKVPVPPASPRFLPRHRIPGTVLDELAGAAGTSGSVKLGERLGEASHAFDHERYRDVLRILRPLVERAPKSAAVRELHGLTLYRLGQWSPAIRELKAYRELTGSADQNPVLMDCYRALRRYGDVEALWDELRQASPGADAVAEGRIVMAGALADQGDLRSAIGVLDKARAIRTPRGRHLRQWYALADLLERAGDIPGARELFKRLAGVDPEAFDIRQRLLALR